MQWIEIKVKAPDFLKEPISNRLFELGALGISESEYLGVPVVHGFFEEKLQETVGSELTVFLSSLSKMFPELSVGKWEVSTVENENWMIRHKEFFKAQELSKNFFLLPAWDNVTVVPKNKAPIRMELGQAFGTGLHSSTRLSINLIERAMRVCPDLASLRFLDVGTGAGILSIVAYKLGIGSLNAIDIDPVAIEEAQKNFKLNGCQNIQISTLPIQEIREHYNIIVSNILLETHVRLAPYYRFLIVAGGQLILSGLLTHQKEELDQVLLPLGFQVEQTEYSGEWIAALYTAQSTEA